MDEIKNTLKIVSKITEYFQHYELLAIPIVVNPLTICLKLGEDEAPNSNLIITRKGLGKSSILKCLAKSNPKYFIELPDKIHESEIVKNFRQDDFERKVWILDDLVVSFRGLNKKQREQLEGFFIAILSKGRYERSGVRRIENAKISCMFGFAQENYSKYSKELFTSTLLDRIVPISYDFSADEIKDIIEFKIKAKRENRSFPQIKLPFTDEDVEVEIPEQFDNEIIELALRLQAIGGLTATRGLNYIQNFLKANALINDRSEVVKADIDLFKLILLIHGDVKDTLENKVRRFILEKCNEKGEVSSKEIKTELEISDKTWEKVLESIKRDIPHRKIGNQYVFHL